jgi:hypothetical protein
MGKPASPEGGIEPHHKHGWQLPWPGVGGVLSLVRGAAYEEVAEFFTLKDVALHRNQLLALNDRDQLAGRCAAFCSGAMALSGINESERNPAIKKKATMNQGTTLKKLLFS